MEINKEYYDLQGSMDEQNWVRLKSYDHSFFTPEMVRDFPYFMHLRLVSTVTKQVTGKVMNVQGASRRR
jgi:hypothetical protein